MAGGELAQDAIEEIGAGQDGDGGEDCSGVPAGGGQGGAGASGEAVDKGPAGQRLGVRDLRGQDAGGFEGQAGGEFDAFVARQLRPSPAMTSRTASSARSGVG